MADNKPKIVTVRLDFETHRKASIKLAETGGSFQDLLTQAVIAWLEDTSRPWQNQSGRHQEEHKMLDRILDAGGEPAQAIRSMLLALTASAAATRRKQTKAG